MTPMGSNSFWSARNIDRSSHGATLRLLACSLSSCLTLLGDGLAELVLGGRSMSLWVRAPKTTWHKPTADDRNPA